MRFNYSIVSPTQNELESLPRLNLFLSANNRQIEVNGLVDSGATVNVLPYQVGLQLGQTWSEEKASIKLAGNLGQFPAIPILVMAQIADFKPVQLAFAWTKTDDVSVILGQVNFFMRYNICFYRSELTFEVKPR